MIIRNLHGVRGTSAVTGKRVLTGAVVTLGLLLALGTVAHARPEPIPKPVEQPAPAESPATGQEAPIDPEQPAVIPAPEGLDCVEGADQSDCDPAHEDGPEGQRPGNNPSMAWYQDMTKQMYKLQESLDDMAGWGAQYDPYVGYYATWMKSVVQQYYALGFYPDGQPREYSYGRMTRGDYNYYHYYWVRPIYFSMLYYAAAYYEAHLDAPQMPVYESILREVAASYQGLVLCNYGFNGDDADAREDLAAKLAEARAGL